MVMHQKFSWKCPPGITAARNSRNRVLGEAWRRWMVTEAEAAAALCQHHSLTELQCPSWESWGHWKGEQGAWTDHLWSV